MKYIALLFALWVASVQATLINLRVKRVIDVSSSHPVAKSTITMQNTGEQPESFFYLAFKDADAEKLSDLWVTEKKRSVERLEAFNLERTSEVPGLDSCCRGYKVSFPTPLAPGAEIEVEVRTDGNGALAPVPAEIDDDSPQYMKYEESSYFFSPYETQSMRTVLVLKSKEVTDKTGLIEPFRISKRRLEMGPYTDVSPFSHNPVSLRFKNDRGLLVARAAEKHFYLSNRGSLSIREEYHVTNAAAKLEGESFQESNASSYKSPTVLRDVSVSLPVDASNIKYMDVLGNVTSLTIRDVSRGQRPVQLGLRHPIAGGEESHFWITYDLPMNNYLKSNGYEHDIELPFFPSMKTDLLSEKLKVRVLLPIGSYGQSVVDHPSLKFDMDELIERKSFTEIGRPSISLGIETIRSQTKHFPRIQVRYKYYKSMAWVVPLVVGGVFLLLCIGLLVCVRKVLFAQKEAAKEKLKSS
ncbi:Dolichyl-diphosphooligosaccharide--protein glycosyltransferase subunit 1 [Gracilariopsis chorda]|uniref:Dolichyl-diphosphooligosaccharide--protein glycosyltransferase subunit 1 n=1 Tax=Gracilariopsis chorda TaxID=448386 RepID=A0A2V3ITM1_9FLOR|nr:Dolichyl-diphosphooligosaccharide--protein glycosyltransferase subunit 1 [Gracilariopsis chorda]|eukprot:PXF45465.1 Dolichyl-diphosphooligosaccharide--protein glycosyltransferase subunit 1 [Gracilariopsis chorda]